MGMILSMLVPVGVLFGGSTVKSLMLKTAKEEDDEEWFIKMDQRSIEMDQSGCAREEDRIERSYIDLEADFTKHWSVIRENILDFECNLRTIQRNYQGHNLFSIESSEARRYIKQRRLTEKFSYRFFDWISNGFWQDGKFKKCKIPKGYPLIQVGNIMAAGYLNAENITPYCEGNYFGIKMTIPDLKEFKSSKDFHITACDSKSKSARDFRTIMCKDRWLSECEMIIDDFTKGTKSCRIHVKSVSTGGIIYLSSTSSTCSSFLDVLEANNLLLVRYDYKSGRQIDHHISIDNF